MRGPGLRNWDHTAAAAGCISPLEHTGDSGSGTAGSGAVDSGTADSDTAVDSGTDRIGDR